MRGRMPGGILLALVVAGTTVFLVWPKGAQADPHALFYTAIGQRQLFFNVLAALNQADFVEPATGNFSRQELADQRDAADATSSVSDAIDETKTDLAAVVSRLITLDGTDLWTNYLALQIAKESAQATDTTAYVELLCAQGLGKEFGGIEEYCENKAPVGKALVNQKRAFVVDPQERENLAYRQGLDILYSDRDPNSEYQKYLRDLETKDVKDTNIAPDYPLPFDESLAALRKKATSDVEKLAVERLAVGIASQYGLSSMNDSVFDMLDGTADGSVELRKENVAEGQPQLDLYMAAVQGITNLPQQFADTAARGTNIANQHLAATETEGAMAPITSVSSTDPNNSAARLGHTVNIASPPYSNREKVAAGLTALAAANANPQGVPAAADVVPGTDPFVERTPDVAGTQDDQREGRVLHAANPSTEGRFERQTIGLDFSSNPAAVHEETGGKHLLLALTNGRNDRSGCGCGVSNVLNDLGQSIVGRINRWKL